MDLIKLNKLLKLEGLKDSDINLVNSNQKLIIFFYKNEFAGFYSFIRVKFLYSQYTMLNHIYLINKYRNVPKVFILMLNKIVETAQSINASFLIFGVHKKDLKLASKIFNTKPYYQSNNFLYYYENLFEMPIIKRISKNVHNEKLYKK